MTQSIQDMPPPEFGKAADDTAELESGDNSSISSGDTQVLAAACLTPCHSIACISPVASIGRARKWTHTEQRACSAVQVWARCRAVAVAQVLEYGIAAHSVIIGIALGVSSSPCTIRPLAAALVFHQMFEGIALGATLISAGYHGCVLLS